VFQKNTLKILPLQYDHHHHHHHLTNPPQRNHTKIFLSRKNNRRIEIKTEGEMKRRPKKMKKKFREFQRCTFAEWRWRGMREMWKDEMKMVERETVNSVEMVLRIEFLSLILMMKFKVCVKFNSGEFHFSFSQIHF
jgi:hypothetical protein